MNPAARHALRRWGEPVVAALAAGYLLWLGLRWLSLGGLVGWVALIGAAIMALWLRAALAAALAGLRGDAPGVVVVREGEIGYMGPRAGGFVPVDAIERVLIVRPADRGPFWRIEAGENGTLAIPAQARDGARLIEALSALPGFSDFTAGRLLNGAEPGRHVVWERTAPAALP